MRKMAVEPQKRQHMTKRKKERLYGIHGDDGNDIYDMINDIIAPHFVMSLEELKNPKSIARTGFVKAIYEYLQNYYKEQFNSKKVKIDQIINNYISGLIQKMEQDGLSPAGSSLSYKQRIIRKAHLTVKGKKNIIHL